MLAAEAPAGHAPPYPIVDPAHSPMIDEPPAPLGRGYWLRR